MSTASHAAINAAEAMGSNAEEGEARCMRVLMPMGAMRTARCALLERASLKPFRHQRGSILSTPRPLVFNGLPSLDTSELLIISATPCYELVAPFARVKA